MFWFCHRELGCKGKREEGQQGLSAPLWNAESVGQSLPLAGCMRVPSPLQPSPASAVTFPQVPNLNHQEEPGQQIYRDIWVKGSCIFWFLTSKGKVIMFLTSQFLYSVPASITLRKMWSILPLCRLYWSTMATAGLWRKERWAFTKFLLHTVHSGVRQQI